MRWSAMIGGMLLATVPISLLLYTLMDNAGQRIGSMLATGEVDSHAQRLRETDEAIVALVKTELGQMDALKGEIDFRNPTQKDVRFLLDVLKGGEAEARQSAARALVEIGDPRSVRLLLAHGDAQAAEEDQPLYYCLAALEILRFKTRSEAAEWLLDVLEDPAVEVSEGCTQELHETMTRIGVNEADVLTELLRTERPRVQLYALGALPKKVEAETLAEVEKLKFSKVSELAKAAREWTGILDVEGTQP